MNYVQILFFLLLFALSHGIVVAQSPVETAGRPEPTNPVLFPPPKDWPTPVEHENNRLFLLADILEYRASRKESDFRWDAEGWYGGDYNRIWFKSEGNATLL